MKINEMKNIVATPELPIGETTEVTFKKIQYRVDQDDNVTGAFVHIENYKSLFIPVFDNENFQLEFLIQQLDAESAAEDDLNACEGKTIVATRYVRRDDTNDREYVNVSFNPKGASNIEIPA